MKGLKSCGASTKVVSGFLLGGYAEPLSAPSMLSEVGGKDSGVGKLPLSPRFCMKENSGYGN